MPHRSSIGDDIVPNIYFSLDKNGLSITIGPRGATIVVEDDEAILYHNELKVKISDIINEDRTPTTTRDEYNPSLKFIARRGIKGLHGRLKDAKAKKAILGIQVIELKFALESRQTELAKKQRGVLSKLLIGKGTLEYLQLEIDKYLSELNDITRQLENSKVFISYSMDEAVAEQFNKAANAFYALMGSHKIWNITSEIGNTVARREAPMKIMDYDIIESAQPTFYLENSFKSQIYIHPTFILKVDHKKELTLFDINELKFQFRKQRFQENGIKPYDSEIIEYAWEKVNKDGSPNLRYKDNEQIPVVNYGALIFNIGESFNETYYISNIDNARIFAEEFLSYLALIHNEASFQNTKVTITKETFITLKEFSDKFLSFVENLKKNIQFISSIYQIPSIKRLSFNTSDELLSFLLDLDLLRCFNLMADISDLRTKEAFGLLYILSRKHNSIIENYSDIPTLYSPDLINAYQNLIKSYAPQLKVKDDIDLFNISKLLSGYDKDLQGEYLSNLYRFASLIVKADGIVTTDEEIALKKILSISEQQKVLVHNDEQKLKVTKTRILSEPSKETMDEILDDLNSLIGLTDVKGEIRTLINFIKIQKAREVSGLKSSSLSYHIVFSGNPGTGKTTVARVIAEIYKNLGVLLRGQLVETDRSGLVAEYVGQTAVKVNKIVDSALDGILFIDEAYSLVGENEDDFGREAVATLIKRMEDDRDRLVVILAGYTDEIAKFIDTNPGLKSRFNRYIKFDDYTPAEMLSIFKLNCSKLEYILADDAETELLNLFTHSFNRKDRFFGNGRFVRNIFEKTLEKQANRLSGIAPLTKEILTTIKAEDIPVVVK